MSAEIPIGERVRFYREAQRKKQTVVAGLAGITVDYLSQIERGLKTPTIPLLHRIARILGVSTAALLGEPSSESAAVSHAPMPAIHRALISDYRPAHENAQPPDLGQLRERVDVAWTIWQTALSRYTEAGALLPGLIMETEQATRAFQAAGEAAQRRQ